MWPSKTIDLDGISNTVKLLFCLIVNCFEYLEILVALYHPKPPPLLLYCFRQFGIQKQVIYPTFQGTIFSLGRVGVRGVKEQKASNKADHKIMSSNYV